MPVPADITKPISLQGAAAVQSPTAASPKDAPLLVGVVDLGAPVPSIPARVLPASSPAEFPGASAGSLEARARYLPL